MRNTAEAPQFSMGTAALRAAGKELQGRNVTRFLLGAFLLLVAPVGIVRAQSQNTQDTLPPISPERGGFTNGTDTVQPRHFQLELGYLYNRADHTHEQRLDDGAQVRYGLSPTVDVRFGLPAYRMTRDSGRENTGWDDTQLGVKWRFLEAGKSHPALALIATTTLPTGSKDTGEHYFQPQLALEVSKDLNSQYSLETDLVYTDGHDGPTRYDQWSGGVVLTRHLTPRLDLFAEAYRQGPQGPGTPNTGFAGGGIIYLLNRDTAFDFGLDNGLFRTNRENAYLSTGISHRW